MSEKKDSAGLAAVGNDTTVASPQRQAAAHTHEDFDCPSCGFAYYGPPALCTCGQCAVDEPDDLIALMRDALNHAENEMIRLRATPGQLAPIRAAIAKAEGRSQS